MKAKRILAALMATAMAAGMMAGCSKDDKETSSKADSSSSTSSTASTEEKEPERLYPLDEEGWPDLNGTHVVMWARCNGDYGAKHPDAYKSNITLKKLEEKCNFTLEMITSPLGQEKDSFSIMISSGDWPDIWSLFEVYYNGTTMQGVEDGVVLDTAPYLDTYAPNFMKQFNSNPLFAKLSMDDDGKIVGFGGQFNDAGLSIKEDWWNKDTCPLGLMVRGDMLKESGLDTPTTIADWYEMLTKFKEMGIKIPYGYFCGGRDNTEFTAAFSGAYDVYHEFMIKQDGNVTYGPLEPGWEDYVTEMAKWYKEGLINPDMAVHKFNDVNAKILTDECASSLFHVYDYWSGYLMPIVQEGGEKEKDMVECPFPTLTEGGQINRFKRSMVGMSREKCISAKTERPEAIISLMDTCYDPDKFNFFRGVEGKAWKLREDGTVEDLHGELMKLGGDAAQEAIAQYGGTAFGPAILIPDVHQEALDPRWAEAVTVWKNSCQDGGKVSQYVTLTVDESDTVSKYKAEIFAYADEWTLKFITGAEPLSKFPQFREGLKNLHVQDLIDAYQAATVRYNNRGK